MSCPIKAKTSGKGKSVAGVFIFMAFLSFGCRSSPKINQKTVTIVLAAHSGIQTIYQRGIIPVFQDYWLKKTEQKVEFRESYAGSGSQVQAIIGGFEADVAALASEDHIKRLEEANLITHSWRSHSHRGIATRSVVAFGLRSGNPKDIFTWEGLARQGVEIVHAHPKTSGIAQWAMYAIYGAGLKLRERALEQKNQSKARQFLKAIEKNVKVMDRNTQIAFNTFNRGIGDVLISSEHEIKRQQRLGRNVEMIIPAPTILIEYPIALVDKNVDKHGNREVVAAFVKFLWTRKVQEIFANYGFRSVDNRAFEKYAASFSIPRQVFDIRYLGGWEEARKVIYGTEGVHD